MALTVEQHKQAVKLGIKQRPDGMWGFKKRCANAECDEILNNHCYCQDSFEDAVSEVEMRSGYTCSTRCTVLCTKHYGLIDAWEAWGGYEEIKDFLGPTYNVSHHKAITSVLKSGKYDALTSKQKQFLQEWLSEEASNWDGDMDEAECGCEV